MNSSAYAYDLPERLIAHEPAEPRDAARLLVYHVATDEIRFDTFASLARYLPAQSLLVLNDTRVVPARVELAKITGGAVRVLFLFNEWKGGDIKGLPDRKVTVGEMLFFQHRPIVQAVSQQNEEFTFKLLIDREAFEALCASHGRTPLPPYIHSALDEQAVRSRYQTVFAAGAASHQSGRQPASVAAPTASLHFTERVFQALAEKGIGRAEVTLAVGRGTFAPVTDETVRRGQLHGEAIRISAESARLIAAAKREGRPVIAAGTTATRLLESAAPHILKGEGYEGETTLFIRPPYNFSVVDGLITNFHLPNTSLLMMLDALLRFRGARRSWRDLYEIAIKEKFRFYSFGDAMLVI